MGRRALVAFGMASVAWASTVSLPAQQPPKSLVFRASADYVQLDVVVTDGNDKAIRDLSKDDFEITEHGKPQAITDFLFESIPPVHRTVTDVSTTAPTIDVVTNSHPPQGRQWVMVIDDLHIIELHLRQTRQVVQEFLESLPPEDQVAIVFVGRSDLSQGFTSDLGAQMRTVGRIKDSLGLAYDAADHGGSTIGAQPSEVTPKLPPSANRTADQLVSTVDPAERDRHRYGLATIEVLKNISASLVHSTYPRKAMVYVSEGMTYSLDSTFYSDYLDFSRGAQDAKEILDQLEATFKAARQAGVPVYAIDPRGLPDCTSVRGGCETLPWDNIRAQMNNMRTLAENTGGLAFVGGSDLSRSVRELVEDNSSFYVLGYYPQPFDRDGKFHDVKVTVKRPGARVRARAGYDAPKAVVAATAADIRRTLDDVLGAALPASGLTLRAFAAPVEPGARGVKTVVTLEVTYPAPFDGKPIDDSLQFGMVALDHDGKIKASTRHAFHFTGATKGAAEVTYAINDVIELPTQPIVLRVGVASQALGKSGAIHIPVDVNDLSGDALQIGAVVMGFAGPPRQAAAPPGILREIVPFQPTTTRTFAPTDVLRLFARLFWASKDASANVTVSVQSATLSPKTVTLPRAAQANGRATATLDTTLPLSGLTSGQYVLAIDARLPGGRTARRTIAFEVR